MAANTYLTPEERTLLESVRVGIALRKNLVKV